MNTRKMTYSFHISFLPDFDTLLEDFLSFSIAFDIIFDPSAPTIREAVGSRDTKTSDFRYKGYAQEISGNVTVCPLKKFINIK